MAGEKRFEATERKRRRSREEGDVAKSRDLTGAVGVAAGYTGIQVFTGGWERLSTFSVELFSQSTDYNPENMVAFIIESTRIIAWLLAPILALVFFSVLVAESLQVGVKFSAKVLAFKPSRLHFLNGLKRMFGFDSSDSSSSGLPGALLFEVGKLTGYLIVMGGVLVVVMWCFAEVVFVGSALSANGILQLGYLGSRWFVWSALGVLLLASVLDLLFQRQRQRKRLMMDAEEFKREHRESEGDPEVKGMRKQLHQEALLQNIIQGVRRARVLIVGREKP